MNADATLNLAATIGGKGIDPRLAQRYAGRDDVCIGTTTSGRPLPELEGLIGFFINIPAFGDGNRFLFLYFIDAWIDCGNRVRLLRFLRLGDIRRKGEQRRWHRRQSLLDVRL